MPAEMRPEARVDALARVLLEGYRRLLADLCPGCRAAHREGVRDSPCMIGTCPDLSDGMRGFHARRAEQRRWEERQARLWARHHARTRAWADMLTGRAPLALPRPPRRRRTAP
jgi:hypothetical protein